MIYRHFECLSLIAELGAALLSALYCATLCAIFEKIALRVRLLHLRKIIFFIDLTTKSFKCFCYSVYSWSAFKATAMRPSEAVRFKWCRKITCDRYADPGRLKWPQKCLF